MWEPTGRLPAPKKPDLWRHGVVKVSAQDEARSFYSGVVHDVEARARVVLLTSKRGSLQHANGPVAAGEGGRTAAEASAVASELRQRWSALLHAQGVALDDMAPGLDRSRGSSSSSSSSSSSRSLSSSTAALAGSSQPRVLGAGLGDEFGRPAKRIPVAAGLQKPPAAPQASALKGPTILRPPPALAAAAAPARSSQPASSRNSAPGSVSHNGADARRAAGADAITANLSGIGEEDSDDEVGAAGVGGRRLVSLLSAHERQQAGGAAGQEEGDAGRGNGGGAGTPDAAGLLLAATVAAALGEGVPGVGGGADDGDDDDLLRSSSKSA